MFIDQNRWNLLLWSLYLDFKLSNFSCNSSILFNKIVQVIQVVIIYILLGKSSQGSLIILETPIN